MSRRRRKPLGGVSNRRLRATQAMAMEPTGELNEQQKMFCIKYLETMNIVDSYKYAYPGVKDNSAFSAGHRLLGRDDVKEYISILIEDYSGDIDANMGAIMKEMNKIAFSDVEIRSGDKLAALKLLGQGKGLFTDKVEVTNKIIEVKAKFED